MTCDKKIKQFVRLSMVGVGRHILSPFVLEAGRPLARMDVPIHLLISSKTWHCALLCLYSLEATTGTRWPLFIHDDGTVPPAGRKAVMKRSPEARWISRQEADELSDQKLSTYPACQRQRRLHNYLMKVTDTLLFCQSGPFMILDADILFYRRPTEICEWATKNGDGFLYMTDNKEAYCMPRLDLYECAGIDAVPLLNAGICCVPDGAMNFDFCESILGKLEKKAIHPMFFDQTLLALAAGRVSASPLSKAYEISWSFFRKPGAICRHYVGPAKFDLLYMEGPASLLISRFFGPTANGAHNRI